MKTFHTFLVQWEERLIHHAEIEVDLGVYFKAEGAEIESVLRDAFMDGTFDLPVDSNPQPPADDGYWPAAHAKIDLLSTRREPEPGDKMKTKRAQYLRAGDVIYGVEPLTVETVQVVDGDVMVHLQGTERAYNIRYEVDDEVEVKGEWTREELDEVIERLFPGRLGTFYSEDSYYLAAVEDANGDMWRVWADGDTESYGR